MNSDFKTMWNEMQFGLSHYLEETSMMTAALCANNRTWDNISVKQHC